jgi:DNA-binding NarL/FixJ family response regulator
MKYFLLIDDHEVVRSGVKNVLQELYQPCTILEAGDEQAAIAHLKRNVFDLIIMDVQIPGSNTMELMEFIKNNYPDAKVLMFSMSAENIYAKKFLKSGAKGFVSKNAGLSELRKAIDIILNKRRYISQELAEHLASDIDKKDYENPFEKLSSREMNVAASLIKGCSVTEMAESLNLSISTVGTYKARVFEKLRINNIAALIELARVYEIQ